jgi:DNA-binding MurR/RpiR family transcriptional regulator
VPAGDPVGPEGRGAVLTSAAPASFDSLRHEVHARYAQLSPHLRRLAQFALDDPSGFALGTVAGIAAATAVQPSSVIRFAKTFGYSGFTEMQRVFRVRLVEGAPDYRERILEQGAAGAPRPDDPLATLQELADANIEALARLKADIRPADLERACALVDAAREVYVIGLRRAFPVAAYLFYSLVRSERRGHLLDAVGGMVPQQVATMGTDDLLVAVSFAEYAPLTVDVVQDVHIRGIPTLTITDTEVSPLARNATLAFIIRDPAIHPLRSLAAPMCLVQSLVVALQRYQRPARPALHSGR